MATEATQESASEYEDTPRGWAQRWSLELKNAKDALKDFYEVADAADDAARDAAKDNGGKRLCLWASSNQVIGAMLFGRTPQASVTRKFADSADDEARVASEMLERVLNCDMQRADDTFSEATRNAMIDWLNAGLGVQWHRYEMGETEETEAEEAIVDEATGQERAPAVPGKTMRPNEHVETDWVHWRHFLWDTSAKVWHERRWIARMALVSKEAGLKLYGDVFSRVPLNAKHRKSADASPDSAASHPWDRAEVWEIWHQESRQVFHFVDGFEEVLKPVAVKEGDGQGQASKNGGINDPLGLPAFFPCQKPLMDVPSTSKLIPVPRFKFVQDLLNSVDVLTTRIDLLVQAVAVKGGYARELGDQIEKLVKGKENGLVPVDNWAMFAEKGGLAGSIVYLPLDQVVATLAALKEQRQEDMDLLYQINGQSDLIRGQQAANGTPGEARIKAKSASVRIQSMQDEIARFASDGQQIRAELVALHFQPETILDHSNIMNTPDADAKAKDGITPLPQAAVQLLQSRFADYRVEIKPEAINLADFTAQKEEGLEVLGAIGSFIQQAQALVAMGPPGRKLAAGLLQTTLAKLKGGAAYEPLVDQFITAMEQQEAQAAANPQPAQQDPKLLAEQAKLQGIQMKGQQDLQKEQFKLQADLQRSQAEVQADAMREQNQMEWNTREAAAKAQIQQAFKPPQMPKTGGGTS